MNFLTLQDIVDRTGLTRQMIHQHRSGLTATPLPPHTRIVSGGPVWIGEDAVKVELWLADRKTKQQGAKAG